ncbi:O-methyltransferase [Fusarium oxysporum f. sp. raphani]|uniref:O-methyltransferase n=1 Tax=Fusarium oxysporum f. sp. raphani TaxID=96318 RepID=A0A8J5QAC6_FUSOX|nr:O-methyltransferase [Fusarium oxysporum f. sp. raphani]
MHAPLRGAPADQRTARLFSMKYYVIEIHPSDCITPSPPPVRVSAYFIIGPSTYDIIATLDAVSPSQFGGDEFERLRVRAAARRLLARVETPHERLTGRDVEPNLLRRLFRLLAAFYVVEEAGVDTFKPTPFSYIIGDESTKVRASLEAATYQYISAGQNLPKHLAKIGYKVPTAEDNNYAGSDPDGLNFFGRLQKSPEYYEAFTGHMEAWTSWKTPWTKIYDPSNLIEGADLSKPLVVDVGGNTGIDISHVLKVRPDLPKGVLVLQDLPEIIERADVDEKITAMAHDFFKPQPVKGSRAYFMHAVVHDWPDAQAIQSLQSTKDAMTKGYSKLFVYDIVLPPTGASISQTTMDVQMLSLLSASERTKNQWEELLTGAGLKIVKFWPDPQQYEMLIEAGIA